MGIATSKVRRTELLVLEATVGGLLIGICGTVMFFASDYPTYVTGAIVGCFVGSVSMVKAIYDARKLVHGRTQLARKGKA